MTCGVAAGAQVESLGPSFEYFEKKTTLQWPPAMQTFTEACWNAGRRTGAAAVVARTADRVYRRTDARTVTSGDPADPLSVRIPGVANEFWPAADRPPGGENYGWGATLPMFIIRNLIGFHEREGGQPSPDDSSRSFVLAPAFPETMLKEGAQLAVRNLHYRGAICTFSFTPGKGKSLKISALIVSPSPVTIVVTSEAGTTLYHGSSAATSASVSFDALNGGLYNFRLL